MEDRDHAAGARLIRPAPVFTGSASLESLAGARIFRIGERAALGACVGLYMRAPDAKSVPELAGNGLGTQRRITSLLVGNRA